MAIFIDQAVSGLLSISAEKLLLKKLKNEKLLSLVTPTVVMYGLEYAQLRLNGQTIGYKLMGLELESADGEELSSRQIIKRMIYRDTAATIAYLKRREEFEEQEGAILPHDRYAGTIVKEQ